MTEPVFVSLGTCPVCDAETKFLAYSAQLRNSFLCQKCHSLPRHRAFAHVVSKFYPNWENLSIHEANPGVSSEISRRFSSRASNYTLSRYKPGMQPGEMDPSGDWQHQDLESQTFPDESFDLVLTQDVFEHVFHPDRAIKEIARTLKPSGAHICTAPLVRGPTMSSRRRAKLAENGDVIHLVSVPEYHGNPIDDEGSLVTIDWGYDIADYFDKHSDLSTTIILIDRDDIGVKGPLAEVLVSVKRHVATL